MIADFRPLLDSKAIHDDESFDNLLFEYCNSRFPGLFETLTKSERRQFLDELVLLIFAHRRKKGLPYLERFPKDVFKIVTDVCESFSDKFLQVYFEVPTLAFLFVWFAEKSEDGRKFAEKAFKK